MAVQVWYSVMDQNHEDHLSHQRSSYVKQMCVRQRMQHPNGSEGSISIWLRRLTEANHPSLFGVTGLLLGVWGVTPST